MRINRLNKQRVYLAGAIDRVADRGIGWRDEITPFLSNMGIEVINPLKKTSNVGLENDSVHKFKVALRSEKKYDELSALMKNIRAVDLRLVDISDFLLVNLDLNTHPCGTYEEIFWANRQKKPILIHIEQGKENAPDWLFGTIPHNLFFSNWEEIKNYIEHVDSSEEIEHYKRWFFFNH